jgi:molybdopterin-guanine dinucleotide biosynthesis protein A
MCPSERPAQHAVKHRLGSRRRAQATIGVVLAGGAGRRMGGSKGIVKLGGRPLISYPVDAVKSALGSVAVVAKIDSELPSLAGAAVWIEPDSPRHPLAGIVHALELAGGAPVMVCAADMPFVTPQVVRAIASADPRGAPAVVAARGEELQPMLGCYQPEAGELLAVALGHDDVRLTDAVAALGPRLYAVEDPDALFNVNTPDDLLVAAGMLDRRRAPIRT